MIKLTKEQINEIKFFIKKEVECHKYGSWDKFRLTSIRIHSDGYYCFKVNWMNGYADIRDDYWVEGNLFNEFPIFAVLDGLDAVQLLFHKIHIKACERLKERADNMIKYYNEKHDHLKHVYEPGGICNKENKNIE